MACSELGSSPLYLYFILTMKKFLKFIRKVTQKIIKIELNIIILFFYFVIFLPFGLFIKIFKDYLKIKSAPSWQVHKEISEIRKFLSTQ